MNDYILSCCSTADLSNEHFEKRNVKYISCHYEMDSIEYLDDLGKTMPFDKFYEKMKNGADTKTSQINANEFMEYFEPFLKEGKDILHVTLSSGISGIYNSACLAQGELSEMYPERKIYIVDSLSASSGQGLLIDKLADLRDAGMNIEELAEWAESNKSKCHAWFFTSDLTFFIKGGRVSKTSGFIGGLLNICPVLHIDKEGHLIPKLKVRTKKKAMIAVVEQMKEIIGDPELYNQKCYISNSACFDDAELMKKMIKENFRNIDGDILINSIGTTIGSHTGPGTVAIFFWEN